MKAPTGRPCKAAFKFAASIHQHLNRHALVTLLGGVSLMVLTLPIEAEVVYTAVDVSIVGSGTFTLDLNHDKKADFTISPYDHDIICPPFGGGPFGAAGEITVTPSQGNGVVAANTYDGTYAPAFSSSVAISSRRSFYDAQALMTEFATCGILGGHEEGQWYDVTNRYLGLAFQIDGETHYGWAELSVEFVIKREGIRRVPTLKTTLTGFAYETIPGQPIKTGQTSGSDDDPTTPDSANPEDSDQR